MSPNNMPHVQEMDKLLEELIEMQRKRLLEYAKRIIPHLTDDDLLQPNDFPELEHHPHFRYQEGLLIGMLTVQSALHAMKTQS